MWSVSVLLAACFLARAHAQVVPNAYPGVAGFGGVAAGFGGVANLGLKGGFGALGGFFPGKLPFAFPGLTGPPAIPKPKAQLSGQRSFVHAGDEEALRVVVREKMPRAGAYGGGYGLFGGLPGLHGFGGDLGLEMEVEIYSDSVYGAKVFIAITEFGGPTDDGYCTPETSGSVIQLDPHGFKSQGGFPVNPAFALPGLAGYGVHPGVDPHADPVSSSEGIVAEINLQGHQLTKINVNSLGPIQKLDDIAGRGVVACTKFEINFQGRLVCTGNLLSCVGLVYEPFEEHPPGYGDSGSYPPPPPPPPPSGYPR